jgi:hypothetical protein
MSPPRESGAERGEAQGLRPGPPQCLELWDEGDPGKESEEVAHSEKAEPGASRVPGQTERLCA